MSLQGALPGCTRNDILMLIMAHGAPRAMNLFWRDYITTSFYQLAIPEVDHDVFILLWSRPQAIPMIRFRNFPPFLGFSGLLVEVMSAASRTSRFEMPPV